MRPTLLARIRRGGSPSRRRQTVVLAAVVVLLLPAATFAATATETIRDEFGAVSYSGNDGTLSWAAPWVEQGEADGPDSGRVRVVSDTRCATGNCLRIGGDEVSINGRGVLRSADLSGATSATLTFSYRRRQLGDSGGSVTLAVSGSGGSGWSDLATYNLHGNDGSPVPQSFDISGFINSATQIRFLGSGSDVESFFYTDNVEISAQYARNTPPVFARDLGDRTDAEGASISIDAGATDPDPDTLAYSATGLPAGVSIDPFTGLIGGIVAFTASSASPHAVNVTVADGNGGTTTDTFAWTITDTNRAPRCDPVPVLTVDEGSLLSFTVTATDPDPGDTLTFSMVGAPPGATIGPGDGALTWTPTETQGPGSYTFDVRVTDNGTATLADTESITVAVGEVNRPPDLTNLSNQADTEGDSVSVSIVAADTDTPPNTLTYSATGLPPQVSINPATGLISGTISGTARGASPYLVTVAVADGAGGTASDTFTWTITADSPEVPPPPNRPPTLAPIATATVDELSGLAVTVAGTDPDGDALTYALVAGPDPIPQGCAIDPATGAFRWEPTESQGPGTYQFRVEVTDNGDPKLSTERDITIVVSEINAAPELEDPGNQYSLQGETVSLRLAATDPDVPSQSLRFTATGLPPGLAIDPDTGRIEGTVGATASTVNPYPVAITARDDGTPALAASVDLSWTITTPAQPIAHSAAYRTPLGRPLNIVLTGVHPAGKPISYIIVTQPASGNLSGSAPHLVYTPQPSAIGADSFTFAVTDGSETSPPATVTITVDAAAGSPVKADAVADITSLERPAVTEIVEPPTLNRTLVLMARATTSSISTMGFPLTLLGLLAGAMLTFGRVTLFPILHRDNTAIGTVHLYDPDFQYGLITTDHPGRDVFFHHAAVRPKRGTNLTSGDRVEYRTTSDGHRDVATTVRLLPTTPESAATS